MNCLLAGQHLSQTTQVLVFCFCLVLIVCLRNKIECSTCNGIVSDQTIKVVGIPKKAGLILRICSVYLNSIHAQTVYGSVCISVFGCFL